MANYLYNGVELPALPEWDKETYPYAYIYYRSDTKKYVFIALDRKSVYGTYTIKDETFCRVYVYFNAGEDVIFQRAHCAVGGAWSEVEDVFTEHSETGVGFYSYASGTPFWSNHDILNTDNGTLYLAASNLVSVASLTDYVIMPGADYKAACDAIRAKTGKTGLIKSGDMAAEITSIITGSISGEGTEFTLSAANWNGTTYSLDITGYTFSYAPQLGLPIVSDYVNTIAVTTSALTIPEVSGTTIIISSVKAPTIDVKVSIFGLVEDTTTTTEGTE